MVYISYFITILGRALVCRWTKQCLFSLSFFFFLFGSALCHLLVFEKASFTSFSNKRISDLRGQESELGFVLCSKGKRRSSASLSSSWGLTRPAQAKVAAFGLWFYSPLIVCCPLSLTVPDSLLRTQHLFPLKSVWTAIGIDRRWIMSLDTMGGRKKKIKLPHLPHFQQVFWRKRIAWSSQTHGNWELQSSSDK